MDAHGIKTDMYSGTYGRRKNRYDLFRDAKVRKVFEITSTTFKTFLKINTFLE
jgi:hypothetical protein